MDSITHIVLGAAVGEILAGRKIGKKALLIGAAAQSLPDIDFVAGLWMSPAQYFLAHRGLTHSFSFIVVMSFFLSSVVNNIGSFKIGFRFWVVFFFIQLLIHILLDSLNAYGTGWFEPFSHLRISYDVLFVVDPFFSLGLGVGCIALLILRRQSRARMKWSVVGIALGLCYIIYAMINKSIINSAVTKSFDQQQMSPKKVLVTPTPLNCWLWYVVVEADKGYYIGYRSVFDTTPSIPYHYFLKNDSLIDQIAEEQDTKALVHLARGFYTIEQDSGTLVFNNLRFGQVNGWANPQEKFVFRYYLEKPNSLFTVQQGRFSGWSRKTWNDFVKKIGGN